MRKQVVFGGFLVFLASFFPLAGQGGDVSFRLEAPESVIAGEDFEVELVFWKGELEDYSRFSQELPEGFSATNVSSPNADFSFSDQRVRIIWLKLPDEEEIQVNYTISVDERLSGQLELTGTFAYVADGERAYISLPQPRIINILPNPEMDPSLVVDVSEFPEMIRQSEVGIPVKKTYAQVIRQEPVKAPNGLVYVNLLIKTPAGSGFLKLEETIPGGYSFESLSANGAVVSQAASLARFVWMRPPQQSHFTIRYRLVPILEAEQQPVEIEGTLAFTEQGATKMVNVQQMDVDLISLDTDQQLALLRTGAADSAGGASSMSGTGSMSETGGATGSQPVEEVSDPTPMPASIDGIPTLQPGTGIVFRVQVAAVRQPSDPGSSFGDSPLLRDVKVEVINGWYKYTVGPIDTYDAAERMRDRINSQAETVYDAFVVAYRDGKRVPVEDVL